MAPVTLGVLGEQMRRIEGTLEEIRSDVKTMHDQALDRRVTTLESNLRWVIRTLAAAFLTAGIGAVVAVVSG